MLAADLWLPKSSQNTMDILEKMYYQYNKHKNKKNKSCFKLPIQDEWHFKIYFISRANNISIKTAICLLINKYKLINKNTLLK